MRLPVDTSVVSFVSAGPAELSIDFDTKQQKTDAKASPSTRSTSSWSATAGPARSSPSRSLAT